jgi:hypothetical protein
MKTKDYAVEVAEKQVNAIKHMLFNKQITQLQAAEMLSKIENIELVTNTDYDDIANEWSMESKV